MTISNIDASSLRRAVQKLGEDAYDLASIKVVSAVRSAAPRSVTTPTSTGRSGALRSSVTRIGGRRAGQSIVGGIVAAAPYASFVDEGTSSHPIRGNPLLRFWWRGPNRGKGSRTGIYFFRRVHHPGTKATRFWKKNVSQAAWVRALTSSVQGITVRAR